jgi:hypothetical protein
VTYQKTFRFYARDTNGKYQIDVDDLRAGFSFRQPSLTKSRIFASRDQHRLRAAIRRWLCSTAVRS